MRARVTRSWTRIGRRASSAGSDDEYALALEVAGVAVAAGVEHAPLEASRVVGHERVPEVPVGDDHAVVGAALAVRGGDLPAREAVPVERPRRRHRRVEPDVQAEAVLGREAHDVVAHLVAAREQRIIRRHREAVEARRVARRDQVQAFVVAVPVAADAVAALEAVDGKAFVEQHLKRAQRGGACADQTVVAPRHAAEYREPNAGEQELIDFTCRRQRLRQRQDMTLQQLTYFLAAAEHGSFTAAADVLHLARPSVSEQIAHLEAELGVALFVRTGRHLELTDAGWLLRPEAERTLAASREAAESVQEVRDLTGGTVALGTFSTAH